MLLNKIQEEALKLNLEEADNCLEATIAKEYDPIIDDLIGLGFFKPLSTPERGLWIYKPTIKATTYFAYKVEIKKQMHNERLENWAISFIPPALIGILGYVLGSMVTK